MSLKEYDGTYTRNIEKADLRTVIPLISQETWDEFLTAAAKQGTDGTMVIRLFVLDYINKNK